MNINEKKTITFDEFRAWLTGLIVGKRGALPDIDDWKMIKEMMDKVVPENEIVTMPRPPLREDRTSPSIPQHPQWAPSTGTPEYPPGTIICSDSTEKQSFESAINMMITSNTTK